MRVVAFAKSVQAQTSPRIAVLSPRRPLPSQLPRSLSKLHSPRSRASLGDHQRNGELEVTGAEGIEMRTGLDAREMMLFRDDRRWLFYPPVGGAAGTKQHWGLLNVFDPTAVRPKMPDPERLFSHKQS
jgi:hypothetical protein